MNIIHTHWVADRNKLLCKRFSTLNSDKQFLNANVSIVSTGKSETMNSVNRKQT